MFTGLVSKQANCMKHQELIHDKEQNKQAGSRQDVRLGKHNIDV